MNHSATNHRFPSDRFFYILGNGWYLESREGTIGPYTSRASAHLALLRLISRFPAKRADHSTDRAA